MPKNRLEEMKAMIENEKPGKKSKYKQIKQDTDDQTNGFENFEVIRQWIDALQENTNQCQEAYNKSPNSKGLNKKLQKIFKNSETIAYNIAQSLKKISANLNAAENKSSAEYRMRLVRYSGLVESFKQVAAAHEEWTEQICNAEKSFIQKCNQIVNQDDLGDERLMQLIAENPQIFTQDYIQNEIEARQQLADIEARHVQLLTIEEHLVEIKNLFVTLATHVELQQDSLNRVEFFAAQATDNVQFGTDQLENARKKKKCGRIMKIGILIGLIFIVLIVIASIFG